MRDKHLWKHLESGKFPEATLSVQRSQLKVPNGSEKFEGDATGTFSLHGVNRQLSFHYAAQRTGSDIHVHGQIKINLKDFNVERPSFASVHTGMLAEITVQFKIHED
jgi:polyisoprenoid-binding protein YceI